MRTTVELPEEIYRRTERAAQERGVTVDALICQVLEREVLPEQPNPPTKHYVSVPLIHSTTPGTLDFSNFDFDDLLA